MKQKLYITALALPTIVLLALPFIPHHHHESAVCTVVEHCSSDNVDNDKHTSHKDDGTKCFEQGSWDVASAKTLHTSNIQYLYPAIVWALSCVMGWVSEPAKAEFAPRTPMIIKLELLRINGLRAPPFPRL